MMSPTMLLLQRFVGDLSKWLITTWDQISNNGAAYGDNSPRKVLKSSDRATCMCFLLHTMFGSLGYIAINSGGSQVAQQQWSGS
jgi:hypothetical protein